MFSTGTHSSTSHRVLSDKTAEQREIFPFEVQQGQRACRKPGISTREAPVKRQTRYHGRAGTTTRGARGMDGFGDGFDYGEAAND